MPVQHRNNVNFVNMTVINTSNATLCYISAYVSHGHPLNYPCYTFTNQAVQCSNRQWVNNLSETCNFCLIKIICNL